MKILNNIEVKYAQGCIAVKEEYKVSSIYNTNNREVEAVFCVDKAFLPCRVCIFKGNSLTPLRVIKDFNMKVFLRSKKGIYSRLDCVAFVVALKGVASVSEQGVVWSNNTEIKLYAPFGVNGESLTLIDIEKRVNPSVVNGFKNQILGYVSPVILSKYTFIKSRM